MGDYHADCNTSSCAKFQVSHHDLICLSCFCLTSHQRVSVCTCVQVAPALVDGLYEDWDIIEGLWDHVFRCTPLKPLRCLAAWFIAFLQLLPILLLLSSCSAAAAAMVQWQWQDVHQ